jgi:hypothetical protein
MKADSHDLASLDRLIAEGKARAALYRGEHRASRRLAQDPPQPPPVPPPPKPSLPSFPHESLSAAERDEMELRDRAERARATAAFIVAAARRAKGE